MNGLRRNNDAMKTDAGIKIKNVKIFFAKKQHCAFESLREKDFISPFGQSPLS